MGRVDLLSRNVGRGIDVDSRKLPIYVNTYITAGGSTLKVFRSADLQKQVGKVLSDADIEPVVVHSRDVPRSVILSRDEFVRLKDIAGEAWPEELAYPIKVHRGAKSDPLGYDTSDVDAYVEAISNDAIAGIGADAVEDEARRIRFKMGW